LGERLPCTQEVIGSNPFTSTKSSDSAGYGAVVKGAKKRLHFQVESRLSPKLGGLFLSTGQSLKDESSELKAFNT
jgi:hypothetical protein